MVHPNDRIRICIRIRSRICICTRIRIQTIAVVLVIPEPCRDIRIIIVRNSRYCACSTRFKRISTRRMRWHGIRLLYLHSYYWYCYYRGNSIITCVCMVSDAADDVAVAVKVPLFSFNYPSRIHSLLLILLFPPPYQSVSLHLPPPPSTVSIYLSLYCVVTDLSSLFTCSFDSFSFRRYLWIRLFIVSYRIFSLLSKSHSDLFCVRVCVLRLTTFVFVFFFVQPYLPIRLLIVTYCILFPLCTYRSCSSSSY